MPEPSQGSPFPILAFVAPIVVAALMWAFTQSPFVLMFAVLGPVIALATMGDSRRRARADLRRQLAAYELSFDATLTAIDEAHGRERVELERTVTHPLALVASEVRDSERWRSSDGEDVAIRLGSGRVLSRVVLDDDPAAGRGSSVDSGTMHQAKARLPRPIEELRNRAHTLANAPIVMRAKWGIGVCGPIAESTALATSISMQLAAALSPCEVSVEMTPIETEVFRWAQSLPHFRTRSGTVSPQHNELSDFGSAAQLSFLPRSGGTPLTICVADRESSLPRDCRIVVAVAGSRAQIIHHPDSTFTEPFTADYVSQQQAQRFAHTLQRAARGSLPEWGQALPERVALRGLLGAGRSGQLIPGGDRTEGDQRSGPIVGRNSLAAAVGAGPTGPVTIDLVTEGPHAIVGGTTGSGKSEVLLTWVLSLAATHRPTEVNFLLIDFKGGAAFAPVQTLPHTVGVLTDLDPVAARRAILSLQAELQRRESILAQAKVRSIVELPFDVELPRLLIIVDEFAAMTSNFAEMHDLFADLAARGRSLGIHLILCTQRPSGSIRDAILANCTLRVSLRVNNPADSVAVVGVPDAAHISKDIPGRGLVLRGEPGVEHVQWAVAENADVVEIAKLFRSRAAPPWRPWLDPLPDVLERSSVPAVLAPAIAFGLTDIPEEQRQEPAAYNPASDGNLFVVGSHHAGKSTMLAALKETANNTITVPSHPEGAWDTVMEVLAAVRTGNGPALLLVDDLDLIISRFSSEYESAFTERVMSLAREGPGSGTALVVTASSVTGRVQAVSTLCTSTLVLRMRDRQNHVLAGAEAASFSAKLHPGGGYWRGQRVQVFFSDPLPPTLPTKASPLELSVGDSLAVISARPAAVRRRLEQVGRVIALDAWRQAHDSLTDRSGISVDRGSQPVIILGDADAWLSSSAILGSLRSRSPLAFHDCSLSEFRSLARIRELPPPLDSPDDTAVMVHPDGRMHRALLPSISE